MHTQLHLVGVRGHQRLVLRRPLPCPVMRRLAAHVLRVRGYQPYPELLAIVAGALDCWAGATTDESRAVVRAQSIRLPAHVQFGGRSATTVGEVIDHLELAGFEVTSGERGVLAAAAGAGRV